MKDKEFERVLKKFGENVKQHCDEQGINIEELSAKTGIRKEYIKKIFAGNCPGISTNHIFILSEALKVQPNVLVTGC